MIRHSECFNRGAMLNYVTKKPACGRITTENKNSLAYCVNEQQKSVLFLNIFCKQTHISHHNYWAITRHIA